MITIHDKEKLDIELRARLEEEIDSSIKTNHGDMGYEKAIIMCNYPRHYGDNTIRTVLEKYMVEGGWKFVYYRKSRYSEWSPVNGESIDILFSENPLYYYDSQNKNESNKVFSYIKGYHFLCKNDTDEWYKGTLKSFDIYKNILIDSGVIKI